MVSNYSKRLDIRTEKKGQTDIIGGGMREDSIAQRLVAVHNEKYSSVFKINALQRITEHVMNKGLYIDNWDCKLDIEKNGKRYERIIEIEHLNKSGNKFRFKKHKIERCIRNNLGILYVHNFSLDEPKLRCFSYKELKSIYDSFKFVSDINYFGGKEYCIFDYSMYDDWVDFNTLTPKIAYLKHMRKILLPQKET